MLKPSADLIIDPKQSRYSLVVGVAKRARLIVEEAEKDGRILVEKPVDLAVHEFMDGKYKIIECPVVNDGEPLEDDFAAQEEKTEEAEESSDTPLE